MNNQNNDELKIVFDSNPALFNLKQKASQIQNNYSLQNKINELMCFVQANKLSFSN